MIVMDKFAETFFSPYDEEGVFNGLEFQVAGIVDPNSYDFEEVGVIYNIIFSNGIRIQAYPEEVELAYRK